MKAAENAVILWQGWLDLNQRMRESKSLALPLGYTPIREKKGDRDSIPDPALFVGWVKGLEPSTSGVTGRRSNQLNYMAVYARCRVTSTQQINYSTYNACCKEFFLAGAERFELSTRGFGDRCSTS